MPQQAPGLAGQPPTQGLPATSRQTFPATADQVRSARHFLAGILGESPLTADAVLCLSELASNATQHSHSAKPGGRFTVRATWDGRRLHVAVEDEGGPWRPTPPGQNGMCGRGLHIVAELADRWGTSGDGTHSRTVWFDLALP